MLSELRGTWVFLARLLVVRLAAQLDATLRHGWLIFRAASLAQQTVYAGSVPRDTALFGLLFLHNKAQRHFRWKQVALLVGDSVEFLVRASYLEIYNEEVRDLLGDARKKLDLKESPDKGVYVKDLRSVVVKDV